jgi:hypothetical protein
LVVEKQLPSLNENTAAAVEQLASEKRWTMLGAQHVFGPQQSCPAAQHVDPQQVSPAEQHVEPQQVSLERQQKGFDPLHDCGNVPMEQFGGVEEKCGMKA